MRDCKNKKRACNTRFYFLYQDLFTINSLLDIIMIYQQATLESKNQKASCHKTLLTNPKV